MHVRMSLSLPVFVLIGLTACAPDTGRELDLSQLAAQQAAYRGRAVVTAGTLRMHDVPLHYWLEDETFNRVALEYGGDLSALVGQPLEVHGTFRYTADRGRWIEVEQLAVHRRAPPPPGS